MKTFQKIIFCICINFIISCKENTKNTQNITITNFEKFIARQKLIKLPHKIELYKNYEDLVPFEEYDTIFLKVNTPMQYYGMLEDTSKFYCIISMYPGDDLVPILYVFDKKGIQIDHSRILIGETGPDCGISIFGYTTIDKNLDIFTKDSSIIKPCDEEGIINNDSFDVNIYTHQFKIESNGKIKNRYK